MYAPSRASGTTKPDLYKDTAWFQQASAGRWPLLCPRHKKARRKRYDACGELEGVGKIDILKSRKNVGEPLSWPSGGWRLCAVQAFSPQAKILAQAEFISAEHLNHRRVEPPFGRRNPKEKDTCFADVLFFWCARRESNPHALASTGT